MRALRLLFAAGLAAGLGWPATAASAATANVASQLGSKDQASAEAERKVLFKQMLADPSNVDLALRYARLSSDLGDLEGAISTLERLLIFAPQVAQLNYELGVLYMRLGAWGQASADLKVAMAAPDTTPEIKANAAKYIAIADQQAKGDYLIGTATAGVRYQTNANGGASGQFIELNGAPFELSDEAVAAPDYNAFLSAAVHGSHDMGNQGGRINLDATLYIAGYRDLKTLNTIAGEAKLGPVLSLDGMGIKGGTFGLYGIAGAVNLGGAPYLYTLGAGGVITTVPVEGATLSTRLEYRYELYQDSTDRPNASDLTGPRLRLTQGAQISPSDWLKIYSTGYVERKRGSSGLESDWEAGASAGTRIAFGKSDGDKQPVTLDMQLGYAQRLYDINDPVFSTTDPRMDKIAFVQGTLDVPLTGKVSAVAIASYRKQVSNYGPLYTYDDASLTLALSTDF